MAKEMLMSNEEILKSYKEAKHRMKQVEILADLNACPKKMIIDILVEQGIDRRAFARVNDVKRIKKEVEAYEAAKRDKDEELITREALVYLKKKLDEEFAEIEAEWQRVEAEYSYKLVMLERMIGPEVEAV